MGSHKEFSADFFNRVWELLEMRDRSPGEDEKMISMSHASLAHWREREDCKPRNLSVGYWQISRVYARLGQAENARHYGQLCLESSSHEPPFYLAYAHEALARAAKLQGDSALFTSHMDEACRLASHVAEEDEKKMLEDDLNGLKKD